MLALAVDADRPLGPVDVLEIDSQCFLTAQTTVVDQPEQCAIARSADGAERGLDLLGIQRPRASSGLWTTFQAVKRIVIEPALLLAPTHEAAQCRVAPIERTGREVLLSGKKDRRCLVRQAGDWLFAVLGYQRGKVVGVALACPGGEARPRQEALQCGVEVWQR